MVKRLGDVLLETGEVDGAGPLLEAALEGYEAELGADHPRTASARISVAELRGRQGRWDECEAIVSERASELPGSGLSGDDARVAGQVSLQGPILFSAQDLKLGFRRQ